MSYFSVFYCLSQGLATIYVGWATNLLLWHSLLSSTLPPRPPFTITIKGCEYLWLMAMLREKFSGESREQVGLGHYQELYMKWGVMSWNMAQKCTETTCKQQAEGPWEYSSCGCCCHMPFTPQLWARSSPWAQLKHIRCEENSRETFLSRSLQKWLK